MNRKAILQALMALPLTVVTGCASATSTPSTATAAQPTATTDAANLAFDMSAWNYDEANNVYWQIGVPYVTNPATTEYETLGIYVPGSYLTATPNGDGTYTAAVNNTGAVNGFTAATAPIVFPVNTPGYSAQSAPTAYSYNEVSSYLQAGFVYVAAGMRGRDNGYDASGALSYSGGAPWGVTDLKAAIRYTRYNTDVLPGNTDSVFVFGMSGGGAQSAIIGASGDSALYTPYLESIGAAMTSADGQALSDAVTGVMAWCPITSLDEADEAYEWNMGQYSSSGTRADGTFTAALSDDLATAYADYINQLGLTDANGNALVLEASSNGIYTTGSYYDYVVNTIETSLNHFLADTAFPYTPSAGGFGGGMPAGELPSGGLPGGTRPAGAMPGDTNASNSSSTTYDTAQAYIDSLNANGTWVTYDAATNTATITSLAGFVNSQKNPSKNVGAFDDLNRSQAENNVFGNDENDSLHFDAVLADLLATNAASYATSSDWDVSYVEAYGMDLKAVDSLGASIATRVNMYNPMYFLASSYAGYQTSTVAPNWRINTGIAQGDTANTVEINLALALQHYIGVNLVDFTTVWGQGHTMAERTGNSTDNFIAWVVGLTQ